MTDVAHPLALVALPAVVLAWWWSRRRARRATVHRRDPITLVGLATVRPVLRYRHVTAPAVLVVALWWTDHRTVAVVVCGALVAAWLAGWLDPALSAERDRCRAWGVADRWLLACVEAHVQVTNRWRRTPYPTPTDARTVGPNVALTVTVPPGMSVETLARYGDTIGAALDAQALRVTPDPDAPMSRARVEVLYRALRAGTTPDTICPTTSEDRVCVGIGFAGPVWWRPDVEPGLGIFGGTGAGKGRTARWVAVQWLDPRYNRRVILIDPQGSGEWSSLARHPAVTYLPYRVTDPAGSLGAIRDALLEALEDVEARNALCATRGVDRWADLSDDDRHDHPRTLILTDEASALLAAVERDDPTRDVRQTIGTTLATIYRTVRKGGYSPAHVDQVTYAGGSYLGDGALGQLGRWIALGGFREEHRRMVAGFSDWPWYAPVPGLGITGVRADTAPEPVEQPDVDRALTDRTLAGWGVDLGAHGLVAATRPVPTREPSLTYTAATVTPRPDRARPDATATPPHPLASKNADGRRPSNRPPA